MIKNIVFDIGNVLVKFSPKKEVEKLNTSLERLDYANKLIVKDTHWRQFLNGELTIDEVLMYYNNEYKGYDTEFKLLLSKDGQKFLIQEIKENTEILKQLNEKYMIYLLSDITKETYRYIYDNFDFAKRVRGGAFSYIEHVSKPKQEIYLALLERYNLNPKETIFIDDKQRNVEQAEILGIKGIQYQKGEDLKKLLEKEGIKFEHTGDNCKEKR